jgi:predicted nucleic acid-binding Zn ribbon protein
MRRRPGGPRSVGAAISALADRLAPLTTLADVQRVWPAAVGEVVAGHAEPTGERDGVLVVTCDAAVWAQELDLMALDLVERINGELGREAVRSLRCQTAPARGWARERS